MASKQKQRDDLQQEEVLQAVVIADSFNVRFAPVTKRKPRALLPLVNTTLLNYTFEFLSAGGIQEIIVFCCAHADKIRQHIRESKWCCSSSPCRITTIVSEGCLSVGDALRDIDAKSLIQSDFVLVNGDVVSNMRLKDIIHSHKERRLKEKTPCMTLILKEAAPGHMSRCREEEIMVAMDNKSNRILHYQKVKNKNKFNFPKEMFKEFSSFQLRYDLLDCGVCVCSPAVPALFSDNFDYQTREDFVKGILDNEEILGNTIHSYILQDEYAARVSNLHMYDAISKDVISRWVFPLVPDNNISNDGKSVYVYGRHNIYLNKDVTLARGCILQENVVIGAGSSVGSNTVIKHSVIGENCFIGENVHIEGAYVWDGVRIEDDSKLNTCLVCDEVTIKKNVVVQSGCVLSYGVVVGPDLILPQGLKLSSQPQVDEYSEVDDAHKVDSDLVGAEGQAYPYQEVADSDDDSDLDLTHDMWGLTLPSDIEEDDSSLSGTDEDMSPPTSPPPDDFKLFYNETLDTLQRAVDENIGADNIVLEINSLKHAYGIPIKEVVILVVKAIVEFPQRNRPNMAATELLTGLKKIISKCLPVFKNYLRNNESQLDSLLALEQSCTTHPATAKVLIKILHMLYDEDILVEDAILKWYTMSPDRSDDREEHVNIRKHVAPFITWLEEAEEDSDDD